MFSWYIQRKSEVPELNCSKKCRKFLHFNRSSPNYWDSTKKQMIPKKEKVSVKYS